MDFRTAGIAPGVLVEITEEQYDYMLNVLPPIYGVGCFAMGEPITHTHDGPAYHWAGMRRGKYYRCHGTRTQAERAFGSLAP